MKCETEIIDRIEELHNNLQLIEEKLKVEMGKHFSKRNTRLLWFLDKEKSVWEFALQQLQWTLSNNEYPKI